MTKETAKKVALLATLFVAGILTGGAFVYWRASASLSPASTEPVVAVDSDLAYDGVYIDLIEQGRIDASSEEDQSSSDPDSSELYVAKSV